MITLMKHTNCSYKKWKDVNIVIIMNLVDRMRYQKVNNRCYSYKKHFEMR